MAWSSLLFSPSALAAAAFALLCAGFLLWLIVRVKQKRLWVPILAIMAVRSTPKPKFTWQRPAWIPLLCFLLSGLLICFVLLRPRLIEQQPQASGKRKTHLLVDLSPSLEAHTSLAAYVSSVVQVWQLLEAGDELSLSTTHSARIYKPQTAKELEATLLELGFHRAGIDLGSAVKKQLAALGELDLLLLFSDRDAHSWRRFNWQYLKERTRLLRIDHTSALAHNVFIAKARYLSESDEAVSNWDVEIERQGAPLSSAVGGSLTVRWQGEILAKVPWELKGTATTSTLRVSWPLDKQASVPILRHDDPLLWTLETSSGDDKLSLDNEFRTPVQGRKQEVVLVADMGGEQILEDPLHQLKISLEVLGFSPQRHDWLPARFTDTYAGFPLWITYVGKQNKLTEFCPLPTPASPPNVANSGSQQPPSDEPAPASVAIGQRETSSPRLWLVPYAADKEHYQNLCWCYSSLVASSEAARTETAAPVYCQDVHDAFSLHMVLKSLGAQPIGGRVDQMEHAIAWRGEGAPQGKQSGHDILAFTLPLQPMRQTGLSHAKLPLLIEELLKVQGLLPREHLAQTMRDQWPRLADLSSAIDWTLPPAAPADRTSMEGPSNVPRPESMLQELASDMLPPAWQPPFEAPALALLQQQEKEAALPWLEACLSLIVALTFVELLWWWWRRRFPPSDHAASALKNISSLLVALLIGGGIGYDRARADINLSVLGGSLGAEAVANIAQQVNERTSLQFAKTLQSFPALTASAIAEPWLWVVAAHLITDQTGSLNPELVVWLKRGGFLIIEGMPSQAALEQLTAYSFGPSRPQASWGPIPPDHELLRSFYLINALPGCEPDRVWHGFAFDQRLAILAIPYPFLARLTEGSEAPVCSLPNDQEGSLRVLINTLMVALTTDYKKDQIHMKEILKRLQ